MGGSSAPSAAGDGGAAWHAAPAPDRAASLEATPGAAQDDASASTANRGRKKMRPVAVVVLVLAIAACVAIAAHFVYHGIYLPSAQQEQADEVEAVDLIRMSHKEAGEFLGGLVEIVDEYEDVGGYEDEEEDEYEDEDGGYAGHYYATSEALADAVDDGEVDFQVLADHGGSVFEAYDYFDNVDAAAVADGEALCFDQYRVVEEAPGLEDLKAIVREYGAQHLLIITGRTAELRGVGNVYAFVYYALEDGYRGSVRFYDPYYDSYDQAESGVVVREDMAYAPDYDDYFGAELDFVEYAGLDVYLEDYCGVPEEHLNDAYRDVYYE